MANKIKRKAIFVIAQSEYVKWITNPRIIIVGVLLVFMKTLVVEPLLERADKMNLPLNILEPFAAIGNSGMLVMLLPCVFLVLVSDYPVMSGSTLFMVQRAGRINWFLGQLLFMVFAIVTFLGSVFVISVCVSGGEAGTNWSDVVTKYNSLFPKEEGNFASQLLPSNLYNQIPLVTAIIQTLTLLSAYLLLLALILYVFKIMGHHTAGMLCVFIVIGLGVVTGSLKTSVMWAFPMANTIIWLHYTEIYSQPVFPVWFSYLYFIIGIALLLAANMAALRKLQFESMDPLR